MASGAAPYSALRTLALWALPLLPVLELGSTAFGVPLLATAALALVVGGALFAARPPPTVAALGWASRVLGLTCASVGLAVYAPTLTPLFGAGPATSSTLVRALGRPEWALVVPVLAAALATAGWARLAGRRPDARDLERFCLLVALGFLALLAARFTVQRLPVLPARDPWSARLTLAAAGAALALALLRVGSQPLRLGVLLASALALRWVGLTAWTPDPVVRDMLPLAHDAATRFVTGDNPYSLYPMQRGSVVPLTYLPGMWGAHSLLRPLGLDGRVIGLVADAVVVLAGWWAAGGGPAAGVARRDARAVVLGLGAVWLFSPSVHWNGIYAEPHPWWALLTLTVAATLRGRFWWAAALLTLGVLTRHFALVFAPFVALALVRALGPREAALRLGVTGALGAGVLLAFVQRDPEAFWFGTVRWLVEYGPAHHTWFHEKYGVTGTLYRLGHAHWLPLLQLGVVLVGLGVGAARRRPAEVLAVGGFTLFCFIAANGIVWDSFFLDAYVVALPLIAARAAPYAATVAGPAVTDRDRAGADGAGTTPGPARARTALAVLATALLAAGAGALGVSLQRSLSTAGHAAAAERARSALAPGDVLVDRSDRRLAFVQGRPLLEDARGLTVVRDLLDALPLGPAGSDGAGPGQVVARVVLVTRVDRDHELFHAAQTLDPTADAWTVGRYRGVRVALPSLRTALDRRGTCRLGSRARPATLLDAPARGSLSTPLALPPGARFVLLTAGYDEGTLLHGRPTVDVQLDHAGHVLSQRTVPQLPGATTWVAALPEAPGQVFVTVATPRGARTLCVLAWAW